MRLVGAVPLAGFSMNRFILPFSANSATPYLVGSSTSQRAMVANALLFLWVSRISL
jgi:hypothetical protein